MTQKRVQELADKLDIPVTFKPNTATSRVETTIRGNHFPRLPDAHIYLVGVEATNKAKKPKRDLLQVDELKAKLTELGIHWFVKNDDCFDLHIKANKDQRTHMTVMHNRGGGSIKSYTMQVNLCSEQGYETRNYFQPDTKVKTSTVLAYIQKYVDYMGSINDHPESDRYGNTVWS